MKMHERIRRKVYLTYSSEKSWKSTISGIRFIENVDLAAISKDFLLLNNIKQTMCPQKVGQNFQTMKFDMKYSLMRGVTTGGAGEAY